jgi:predicted O-methyltransferase YrrM
MFRAHELEEIRGAPAAVKLEGLTHRAYYERRFADSPQKITINEGQSWDMLARWPDDHFDLIYIDAAHDYDSVKKDAEVAVRKIKRDGILVFNDYILWPGQLAKPYGVIQAVNDLVVNHGWHVAGFALARRLFCDIAIVRERAGT